MSRKSEYNSGSVNYELDDLDEEDVAKLAFKALEEGKPIECYLDYMDEDAIKKLLLKSVKR